MNCEVIRQQILSIYERCHVKSFPIDCLELLDILGISHKMYSELPEAKRDKCYLVSDDAFTLNGIIYYNFRTSCHKRTRFSLMHELGHIVLKHWESPSPASEQEANYFSSNILAPRIAIHYSQCKNANDVSKRFGLSLEAADYAFNDYKRWHRMAAYRMPEVDSNIYHYFYDEMNHCFVWKRNYCPSCGKVTAVNSTESLCEACKASQKKEHVHTHLDIRGAEQEITAAQCGWFY